MLPFRMKTDINFHWVQQPEDIQKSRSFDEEDFTLMVVPNSCFSVITIDRFQIPGLDQKENMTANFGYEEGGNFTIEGNWLDAGITLFAHDENDESIFVNLDYKIFVTYNKTVFGQRISGIIGVSPSLPEDNDKSFYYKISDHYLDDGDYFMYMQYDTVDTEANNKGTKFPNGNITFASNIDQVRREGDPHYEQLSREVFNLT